ncbi:TetR/AcrR family transcriptional regulator [Desulfovibrio inopinatus]|uniref:TetR/AcrR family transcriptional regulator n=1 Tax=Desulfovibrio inopinatus TaxID=102109 RepID=UPI0003F90834|nr:TetR/AcrR family transcriptional regulator [Desulfovibrio inopinatus]
MAKAQYDRNDIIDKAIDLFWRNGYSGSSMQQVVKATGLKPGSLYYSFGNKEALFKEALERYAQQRIATIRQILDTAPNVGEGICKNFERVLHEARQSDYKSCLLVKTQLELASEGNALHEFAAAKLREVEAVFQHYLEREFDTTRSQYRATSIMLHIFGIRVYGYQCDAVDRIRQGLREGLPWLPWPQEE